MKIISVALLTLAIISGTAFAKTESMYISDDSSIDGKTFVTYPPSIDRISSQVGEPNFDIFYPRIAGKSNLSVSKNVEILKQVDSVNGTFISINIPENKYGRIIVSDSNDNSPNITYIYNSEKLYSAEFNFENNINNGSYHKYSDLIKVRKVLGRSLLANGFKQTSGEYIYPYKETGRNNYNRIYIEEHTFLKNGKNAILYIERFNDSIIKIKLSIYEKSYNKEDVKKVQELLELEDLDNINRSQGNLFKSENDLK